MDRFDRIYRLYSLFANGREARSAQSLQADLRCSRATLMRAIAELRDLFGAPLIWDAAARGYRFDGEAPRRQLPGLWFSADELQALLLAQSLLAGLSEGLMPERIDALRGRVTALLAQGGVSPQQAAKALRVLPLAGRTVDPLVFRQVVSATLGAHRLAFHYRARSTGDVSERVVSPQRLVPHA
jgi:predicted DNA-binding transcriptional regulator YafY